MIYYNYTQWIKYILKERIISTNEKEKDMLILNSIIKMNDTMERKYTEYEEENCIYHERECYKSIWFW